MSTLGLYQFRMSHFGTAAGKKFVFNNISGDICLFAGMLAASVRLKVAARYMLSKGTDRSSAGGAESWGTEGAEGVGAPPQLRAQRAQLRRGGGAHAQRRSDTLRREPDVLCRCRGRLRAHPQDAHPPQLHQVRPQPHTYARSTSVLCMQSGHCLSSLGSPGFVLIPTAHYPVLYMTPAAVAASSRHFD